jgi:hypothetical protein
VVVVESELATVFAGVAVIDTKLENLSFAMTIAGGNAQRFNFSMRKMIRNTNLLCWSLRRLRMSIAPSSLLPHNTQ